MQHLYETIKSFVNTCSTKFNYQEEPTLHLHIILDYVSSDEDADTIHNDDNEVDDEWINEANEKVTHHLK